MLASGASALTDVVMVSPGMFHAVALKRDGTVVAWGKNDRGQTAVPPGLKDVVMVAAGFAHSVAPKSDGAVVVWGSNRDGEGTAPMQLR